MANIQKKEYHEIKMITKMLHYISFLVSEQIFHYIRYILTQLILVAIENVTASKFL